MDLGQKLSKPVPQPEKPGTQKLGRIVCPGNGQPEDKEKQQKENGKAGGAAGKKPVKLPVSGTVAAALHRDHGIGQAFRTGHKGGNNGVPQLFLRNARGGLLFPKLFQNGGNIRVVPGGGAQVLLQRLRESFIIVLQQPQGQPSRLNFSPTKPFYRRQQLFDGFFQKVRIRHRRRGRKLSFLRFRNSLYPAHQLV